MSIKKNSRSKSFYRFIRVFFSRGWITELCFGIITVFVVIALLAPLIAPYSPYQQDLLSMLKAPSAKHILGTDSLGRDTLSRLMFGARVSLTTGILASIWAAMVGSILGLVAGYFGGWLETIIMRLTDAMIAIPPIIFTMVLSSMIPGNLFGVSVIIGVSIMPTYIRIIDGLVLSLKENDYITAANLIGQKQWIIMIKHLLPNCFATLIVTFTMNIGTAIMLESTLSYLGVGIIPPTPAWGVMVSEGYKFLFNQPLVAILPGICIMLVVIAFNIVGDALRDALDPRLRGKL